MSNRVRTRASIILVTFVIGLILITPTPSLTQSGTSSITSLSPTSARAGTGALTLNVNRSNSVTGAVVRFFNGLNRSTTFFSTKKITSAILATDIVNSGNLPITVLNPAPAAVTLFANPAITTISPATVRAGDIGFNLTVNGTGFVTGSVVNFNGVARSTTFVSSVKLTTSILQTDFAAVGTYPITVLTPAGLVSNAVNITAIPEISNLTPMVAPSGSAAFTLTVTGRGFVSGAVVRWNGSNRTTTFVNSTKLTAAITAADLTTVAARPITVLMPAPTNLVSNAINFNVTNLPPATECAAGSDVTLANPGLINSGPARSQMWRTDDNVWWGAFSDNTNGIYLYKRVDALTWAKGPLIDTNIVAGLFVAGAPDTLWTGTNLFILIQESTTLAQLYKYTYTPATTTYTIASGFPVSLPLSGIGTSSGGKTYGTLGIVQDATGKLWAAYTGSGLGGDGTVRVISSTSADHKTWDTTGFVLGTGISTLKTEGSTIVRFGTKVGVGWSNLNTNEDAFRAHNDADPATTWGAKETIDSGLGPQGTGGVAAKQMTMKAHPDGRVFLIADDSDGLNNHLHLYIRTAAGVWGSKTLVVNDFNALPSKPVLLLDTDNSQVNVIYKDGALTTNGLSGQTFITQSSMTNPTFNTPCLFIDTSDDSALSTSNPTSTKQTVNATTDLMVAASTGKQGNRVLVNTLDVTPNALTIFAITPKEDTAGAAQFTMTVTGKLFAATSSVRFNGTARTTTFVNAGKLTAVIPNTDIATAGTKPVIVRNSLPTVDSNTKNFTVTATNPVPNLTLMNPIRELVGNPAITMTLNGTAFRRSSVVRFNGNNRTTTFVSDTQLTATIPATDFLVAGPYPITVFNSTPGGGTSVVTKRTSFFVEPPCATPSPISFSGVTLFNTNKSQMWYNDGFWWGAFSDNLAGVYFYKQNGINPFTKGSLIDGNFNGRPDVMWNGTNLFVLVYEFNTQAKFYKYSYNPATDVYTIVPGFPVTLPLIGVGTGTTPAQTGSVTIAQDSTGKIWGTYPGTGPNGDGNYRVIWTTSADHKIWDTNGFILETNGALITQEVTNIVHFGGNKIGIAWSHQLAPVEDGFRYHVDGDPENVWSAKELIDSGLGNEVGIGGVADNHGSMRAAPDGRIFLVAKDSDDVGFLHLYIRSAAGVWGQQILVDIDPHAQTTRPTLVLDLENREVYIFYADATTSLMYAAHTSMDNPVFGPSCPYVTQAYISDATSTKQNVTASMGLMAAGSTGTAASAIYINPIVLAAGSGNVPVITNLSPSVALNGPSVDVTVNGSNFGTNAVVYLNGIDRPTTFVSPTKLIVRIFARDVTALGPYPVTVMNPKGGTSAAVNLTLGASITSLTPASATAGDPAFTLTVDGIGFSAGATASFNGSARATTFVGPSQVTAQILAADVQTAGSYPVTITSGTTTSQPFNFIVNNAVPTLASLSPVSALAAGGGFTLTVNGTNYNSSSVVSVNGQARATAFVSSTQLTASILALDVAAAGSFSVAVTNPAPGGGSSAPLPVAVLNPLPATTSLAPAVAIVGSGAFTLNVNGSGFVNGSVVSINGAARTTAFVSPTVLTAQVLATDIQTTGNASVTVFNPLPGGGTSNPQSLSVNNPVPVLSSISPASKTAGDIAFNLQVNGSNFNSDSVVNFNGSPRTTAFVSTIQVTAQITAADVQAAGTPSITVFNPLPGGGTSTGSTLTVNNPVPTVSSLNPSSKIVGDQAFLLTVNGTNFNSSSVVRFNGSPRTTALVSATQVTAQITAADLQSAGTPSITVNNPAPGGGTSAGSTLTINNPLPTITGINPPGKTVGDAGFTITVDGTGFVSTSVVRFNGSNRATTFGSTTQLTAVIPATDLTVEGNFPITVLNGAPGGGVSNPVNLSVVLIYPVPTISSLSPANVQAGDPGFTLAVNGTGLVTTSVVQWNGQPRSTSYVSATQVTTQITASDVAIAGPASVTVVNPAPGGGTSTAASFTITVHPRTLSVIGQSGGGSITIPIRVTAVGDEAAFGFSINFDPALLSNPQVTLGADVAGASINGNANQAASGRFGVALAMPAGQTVAAGTLTIANITFTAASVASLTTTPITFGDLPVVREVSSVVAQTLPAAYNPGSVTITIGFEADVAPRPNGNNSVSISDWVQTGRFSSGLDTAAPGSEFQRADCAPRTSSGNGSITISDWVQAGRYASGLDTMVPASGPTGPVSGVPFESSANSNSTSAMEATTPATVLRLVDSNMASTSQPSYSVEIDTQGNENALSFSMMFDETKFSFVKAEKSDELNVATLIVNKLEAKHGRVGVALALPSGNTFGAGTHQVVTLTFEALVPVKEKMLLSFTDLPIRREVVDVNANSMKTSFQEPVWSLNPIEDPQFFVLQQYLDFFNRPADTGGVEYWTRPIKQWR